MENQILDTWYINNRVNLMLIEAISEEGFNCTLSKRGGRNVALQFAHLHNVRLWRFERFVPELLGDQTKIDKEKTVDRDLLLRRFRESADAMARWLHTGIDSGGSIKGFKRGVIAMLGYLIAHEAHHRGSILLTLKQCGHAVKKEVRDNIWGWNQI